MAFVLIHGSRVRTHYEKQRKARCGRCLTKTTQAVSSLVRSSHLYFIEYNQEDIGRIAECETCKTVFPVRASEGESRKERWADAFLDAHIIELDRADKSNWVVPAVFGLGLALCVAGGLWCWLVAQMSLDPDPMFFVGAAGILVEFGLAAWVYRGLQERIGNRIFGRAIRTRLLHLDQRFEITPAELALRAGPRGYPRLARHFESALYARANAREASP